MYSVDEEINIVFFKKKKGADFLNCYKLYVLDNIPFGLDSYIHFINSNNNSNCIINSHVDVDMYIFNRQ